LGGSLNPTVNRFFIFLLCRPAHFVVGYFPDLKITGKGAYNDITAAPPVVDNTPNCVGLQLYIRLCVVIK
jgi:hypothetical protein